MISNMPRDKTTGRRISGLFFTKRILRVSQFAFHYMKSGGILGTFFVDMTHNLHRSLFFRLRQILMLSLLESAIDTIHGTVRRPHTTNKNLPRKKNSFPDTPPTSPNRNGTPPRACFTPTSYIKISYMVRIFAIKLFLPQKMTFPKFFGSL